MISKSDHPKAKFYGYIDDVLSGEVVAGRYVRLACQRQLDDEVRAKDRGYQFSWGHAAEAIEFFEKHLRHSKGEWAGKPFMLSDSQRFIVGCVFGWRRIESGYRRFSRVYMTCGRKWGKTEFASGFALKLGTCDVPAEPGAEIYICATKEDQARDLTFRQCCRMVAQSPVLAGRLETYKRALVVPPHDILQPNSTIKPVGSDSKTSDGFDLHGAILDELHAWQKRHAELYDKMTTAGGSRRQELIVIITTAGSDDSEIWQRLDGYYCRVLDAVTSGEIVSDNHFGFVARIDEQDDPFDEAVWPKANPNYPVTPKHEYLVQQRNEAKDDPIERQKFLRYHCNVRVEAHNKPIDAALWRAAEGDLSQMGTAHGGIDLGRSDDFAAWAIVWDNGGKYEVTAKTYCCAERPKYLKSPQFAEWIASGELIEHPGDSVDFNVLQADILEASRLYGVTTWAFDPHFAKQMGQNLVAELGEDVPFEFTQAAHFYNEPIRNFVKALKGGQVTADGNRCTRWQADNLRIKPNAKDEWMPDKSSREYKIDAMVAILMAFSECLFAERETEWTAEELGV